MRKSLRLALTRPTSLYKEGCFPQKDRRRVRVSLPFLHYTEKRYRGKSRYLSWRRRRDSTGFQPVVFALRTVYFMSLFAPQKDGRRVRVSLLFFLQYTEKRYRGNPDTFPGAEGETRRVFYPSCSLCEQFILCPFCSAKRWTESSSLSKQIHIYKKKKHKGKILVLFLAQKERLELSRRLPDLRP